MKTTILIGMAAMLFAGRPARAGVDAPGQVWLHLVTSDGPLQIDPAAEPKGLPAYGLDAEAFFSTDASSFGDRGVLIWSSFRLTGSDCDRHATLLLDLAVSGARLGEQHPLGASSIAVDYHERCGDRIVFEGRLTAARVYLVGFSDDGSDDAAIEGRFGLVLADSSGADEGTRALLAGGFLAETAPPARDGAGGSDTNWSDQDEGGSVEVDSGCGLDASDDEPVDSGCGGGSWDEDTNDSGCDGDTWDEDTDDSAACAVAPIRGRADPLRALLRFLPELVGLTFIGWLRRRLRHR